MARMTEHGVPRVLQALPFFGIPVNAIPIKGSEYAHYITTCTPNFFNLPLDLWGTRAVKKLYRVPVSFTTVVIYSALLVYYIVQSR